MQNFTLGRKGLNWFLFAFILFIGNLASYGQDCATPGADQDYCYLETVDDLRYSGATNGAVFETADTENDTDPIDGNELLTNGETYFIGSTTEDCDRVPVTVAVDATATPMNTVTNNRGSFTISPCESAGFTAGELEDLFVADSGYELEVYDTEFGENALAPTDPLVTGNSYFVGQVDGDTTDSNDLCPSTRAAVGFDPLESPSPTADAEQTFCEGATVADLMASGTEPNTQAIRWYRSQTSNSPLADDVELVNGEDYFAAQVVNDRNSPFPPCETSPGERTRVVAEVINFDAGADIIGEICEDDLRERIANGEGASILLGFITDGRDLPEDVTFNPSLGALAQQFANNPTQPIITTATFTTPEECTDDVNFNIEINESFNAGDDNTEDNIACRNTFSNVATEDEITDFLITLLSSDADSGGTFTNVTSITNDINAGLEGPFMSTYTVGAGEPCEDSADLAFQIDEADELGTQTGNGIYCQSEIDARIAGTTMYEELAREIFLEQIDSNVPQDGDFVDMTLAEVVEAYGNGVRSFMTTYSVTTENGCTSSVEISFDILEDASSTTSISRTLCVTDAQDLISNPVAGFAFLQGLVEEAGVENFDATNFSEGTFDEASSLSNFINSPTSDSETFNFEYTNPGDSVCSNEIINIAITINNLQDAEAGDIDNQVACTTDGMIDLNQYLDGSGAQMGGTFSGEGVSDNMFDASIGASEEGYLITYSINGEDSECIEGEDSTTFRIFVNEPGQAVAEAMDDEVNVCTSETSYNLNAALSDDSTLGGTFSLNGEELEGNIFDASTVEAGEYTFTYTVSSEDADCIEGEASTSFTINVTSDFEFGNNITAVLCESEVPENLTADIIEDFYLGLVSGLPSGGTFVTSPGEILAQYNNNPIGTFTTTYTVDNGECQGSVVVSVTIQEEGPANAGDIDNQVACTTDGMIDLNQYLDGSGAQMGGTFSGEGVSDNMFDASIGASEEGYLITYSINGEDSECIEGEDSTTFRIFVNEPGQAVADAMNDEVNVCTSETSYNLNAALSDDSTLGGTFSLNGEELEGNIFDASTAEAGEYTFTYTVSSEDAGCIEGEASTSFTINVTSETFDAGEDVTFTVCSVGLNPTPTIATVRNYFVNLLADGVPTDGTFTPSIEDIRQDYLENQIGSFTTTYTIGNGTCEDSVELTVVVTDLIPAEIGDIEDPDPICRNAEDVDLFSFLPEDANPNGTFEGYEDGVFSPGMMGAGNFEITYALSEDSPCTEGTASATFTITVQDSAFAGADMDLSVCMSDEVQNLFDFISVDADNNGEFTLDGDVITDGMMNPADFEAGEYEVIYTVPSINDCGEDTATFNITVDEAPDAPTVDGNPFTFCATDGATGADLSATGTNLTYYTDEALSMMLAPEDVLVAGTYYVTQRNEDGTCESVATEITVNINDAPTPTISESSPSFCEFDDPTIADLTDLIEETGTITWYDSEDGDNALSSGTSLQDGVTYYATLFSQDTGCESSVRLAVTVSVGGDDCDLFIPEGFSPNGDNTNEEFEIRNLRNLYPNFTIEIRNRFGDVVYKGNQNNDDWNGTSSEGSFGSGVLPVGAYFYYLRFNDGSTEPVRGTVYLSR